MLADKKGKVVLLVGKVACGKTTYARKMEEQDKAFFLSLDELQLDLYGTHPTREQLDSSRSGCCEYQKRLAVKLVNNGFDVYLDWGFWERSVRCETRQFFENKALEVKQYYFNISLDVRIERNRCRNSSDDKQSYKLEEKDLEFFDSFFEEPDEQESDLVFKD